ncbi:MAG TPA: hypothetical protein VK108_02545 [Pseudogracilibacillus sp.]|nr:hypothetical protein [Pseudogracilibacillus sp.]
MRKFYPLMVVSIAISMILSGCLYPQNELKENEVSNDAQLEMVQTAVNQYQEETDGLVPIKTKEDDTDQYQKYLIDFSLLQEEQLLEEIPGSAYENGGSYQYTILDPEEEAEVKLIDLRATQKLRELNRKLDMYRNKHQYPPFGETIEDGVYKLNYKKLGYEEEPYVASPYSDAHLPFIITEAGEVYIDYSIDLKQALDEFDGEAEEGEDIRSILEENYPIVPAYSLPYTVKNDEPIIMFDEK